MLNIFKNKILSDKKQEAINALDKLEQKVSNLKISFEDKTGEYQDLSNLNFRPVWEEFIPDFMGKSVPIPGLDSTLLVVSAPEGKTFPFHFHPQKEWIYILEGEIRVMIKKQGKMIFNKILTAGDSAFFDSNDPHAVDLITGCIYIVQWNPKLTQEYEKNP